MYTCSANFSCVTGTLAIGRSAFKYPDRETSASTGVEFCEFDWLWDLMVEADVSSWDVRIKSRPGSCCSWICDSVCSRLSDSTKRDAAQEARQVGRRSQWLAKFLSSAPKWGLHWVWAEGEGSVKEQLKLFFSEQRVMYIYLPSPWLEGIYLQLIYPQISWGKTYRKIWYWHPG